MKRYLFTFILIFFVAAAYGQGCAVCSKVAAGMSDKSAKGLNGGILYLAFLPLAIMGTIGALWHRHNKNT